MLEIIIENLSIKKAERIMNKPSLTNYGLSENQYSKYKDYKLKLELRNEKLDKFEEKFYIILSIIVSVIVILSIYCEGAIDCISGLYSEGLYFKLILLIILAIIPCAFLMFIFIIINGFMLSFISLLGLHKPFKRIYEKFQSTIPSESYYKTAERYEIEVNRLELLT